MSWRRLLVGDAYKGHRLDIRRRESSINQQLTFESKLLRCPEVQEIRENSALFSRLLQRTRKSWTGWRREMDSNSRDPFGFDGRRSTRGWRTFGHPKGHP